MAIENGVIILEGNIGAGKTTLAHKISAAIKRLGLKSQTHDEVVENREIVERCFDRAVPVFVLNVQRCQIFDIVHDSAIFTVTKNLVTVTAPRSNSLST